MGEEQAISLSILIRSKNDPSLRYTFDSLLGLNPKIIEIVLVDSSDVNMELSSNLHSKTVNFDGNRTEAFREGARHLNSERVLLLDADQIINKQLIDELSSCSYDMCIIN